jgi:hypothetical protein
VRCVRATLTRRTAPSALTLPPPAASAPRGDDDAPGGGEERRRSFEAPDVIDAEAADATSAEPAAGGGGAEPPRGGGGGAPWQLWDDALAAAGPTSESEAARLDAAADAVAAEAMRRTRQRAEDAVDAWLVAVQRGSAADSAALFGPLRRLSARELLWAWVRLRVRSLRRVVETARWVAAGAVLATAAAMAWGRPALNDRVLPWVTATATVAAARPVQVGRVRWLLPTGVTGLTPLATLGPCALGAGAVEKSTVEASAVSVWLRPLASLLQGRAVLHAVIHAPTVALAQADNHSWLGYPDDTVPSSRPVPSAPPVTAADADAVRAALTAAAEVAAEPRAAAPRVVLGSVALRDGTCLLHVHGDAQPRRVQDVSGVLRLGGDYSRLDLDIRGRVRQRDPEGRQTTMLMSDKRHLRDSRTAAERALEAAEAARGGDGGAIRVRVDCRHLGQPGRWADLLVRVGGKNLHGPVLENLLDIPMDIYGGRLDGEVRLKCYDADSWDFPELGGSVRGTGLGFHFHDAPDDFAGVDMDMLFEGRRLYLHGASGYYGAIPLTATGDIDVTPERGEYHVSANIPLVDANELRETLGGRPPPRPVAGALRGTLHCTGPLEKPVFMGTAVAVRDAAHIDALARPAGAVGWAAEALATEPRAVAAYDRIPFDAVKAVFTLDTATSIFQLHEVEARPAGGGRVRGSGFLRVDPEAEFDPTAMRVQLMGEDLDGAGVLRRYEAAARDAGVEVPPALLAAALPPGPASMTTLIAGSLMTPGVDVTWAAPSAEAAGSVRICRANVDATLRTPSVDLTARLDTVYPPIEVAMRARTQAEAMAAAEFTVAGADAELAMHNLDVGALAQGDALDKPERLRLRLSGKTRFAGRLDHTAAAGAGAAAKAGEGLAYRGELQFTALRLNQLVLAPSFSGSFSVSPDGVHIDARGRPDEALRIDFVPAAEAPAGGAAGGAGAEPPVPPVTVMEAEAAGDEASALTPAAAASLIVLSGDDLTLDASAEPTSTPAPAADVVAEAAAPAVAAAASPSPARFELSLRRGQLRAEATVAGARSRVSVASLKLDDLEVASLRGRLDSADLELDLEARSGRGQLRVAAPRFSGLQGESLSAQASWAGDVVRLESAVLQQAHSRYQLAGEYVLPEGVLGAVGPAVAPAGDDVSEQLYAPVPTQQPSQPVAEASTETPPDASSVAAEAAAEGEQAHAPVFDAEVLPPSAPAPRTLERGRWRWRMEVPGAEAEEMLPAVRLLGALRRGSARADYARAKAAFLDSLRSAGVAADTLSAQLKSTSLAKRGAERADAGAPAPASPAPRPSAAAASASAAARAAEELPGLQDLRGAWRGSVGATGGGADGAVAVGFDLHGDSWHWGAYAIERMDAAGAFHTRDGLQLDRLAMSSGQTRLRASGALLGPKQSATFRLDDFPAPMLATLARSAAAPGGAHVAAAAAPVRPLPAPPAGGAGEAAVAASAPGAGAGASDGEAAVLSGLLFMSGDVAGSASAPEGKVSVRLLDGAVGRTRLAVAEGAAALTANQRVTFDVQVAPAASEGHVKVTGSAPLRRDAADASLLVDASVKDSGMLLLSAVAPGVEWRGGTADVALQLRGTLADPVVDGSAAVHKASIAAPGVLPRPLSNLGAAIRIRGNTLHVDALDGRLGRRGHLKVRGALPFRPPAPARGVGGAWAALVSKADAAAGIRVELVNAEVRARNAYAGGVDAALAVRGALLAPEVSGEVTLSRGIAYLSQDMGGPQAPAGGAAKPAPAEPHHMAVQRAGGAPAGGAKAAAGAGASGPNGSGGGFFRSAAARAERARRAASSAAAAAAALQAPAPALAGDAGAPGASFNALRIKLGPELRVVYPFVLNFGIAGELELTGPASDPARLRPVGGITFTSGEVNLVATQVHLNREHPNRAVFTAEAGLDPLLDVCLMGADLRVLVQGRASAWQEGVRITTAAAGRAAPGGEAAPLTPTEAARIFEGQLAESLLQGNGQLAFSNLANSTIATLLPKIETQGQLGKARWRLVSAPSIPGLLSLDPSTDPFKGLASLSLGTEVEVQFGRSVAATVARKLKDSEMQTQFSVIYQLSSKLRMQLNSVSSAATRLLFEFST